MTMKKKIQSQLKYEVKKIFTAPSRVTHDCLSYLQKKVLATQQDV